MALKRSTSTGDHQGGVITAIAIDRDKNSQFAVKWAVDNLVHKNNNQCILIHVRCQSLHPQDFDSVPQEGRPPTEEELQKFFLPYRGFCARNGIHAKEVVLHDIDVPSALVDYVTNNPIGNVVVGASNRSAFTWKFRGTDVASSLIKSAPETCAVYVISKGRVQSSRAATSRPQTPTKNAYNMPRQESYQWRSQNYPPRESLHVDDRSSWSGSSSRSEGIERIFSDRSNGSLQTTPHRIPKFRGEISSPSQSISSSSSHDFSGPPSFYSNRRSPESLSSASEASSRSTFSHTPYDFESEMTRLKLELQQQMDVYHSASVEAALAKEKVKELYQGTVEHAAAMALADIEMHKTNAAMEAARMAERLAEMETQKRIIAEMKAESEEIERKKAMNALSQCARYRKYTIEEIEVATDYFSSSNKIGEGGYGPVYIGKIDHTAVAIKALRPDVSEGPKQFQKEVEVLSMMRHPNMVLLLGACPEYGCLVYEYMENGSLEDRLFRKNNTPPLSWKARFRITAEIAIALLFLHQSKPEPLVHRDLKPANILLDRNFVSKIADVGLARLVPPSVADSVTQYHLTAAAGTFCYIDPEYQQTGMLGVKSDLYSFGVMMLQIITARPPVGLSHQVGQAIEKGTFSEILDPTVTDWPVEAAQLFAELALKCCELRKRDRPDLAKVVLPQLIRLRDLGTDKEYSYNEKIPYVPRHYNSVPPLGPQIYVSRRWRHLKTVTKMLSFMTTSRKSLPPRGRKQVGRGTKKPHHEGCWSFIGCPSSDNAQLKKWRSFS